MDQAEKDAGTIAALMLSFKESRLPRAKRLLAKVNEGNRLSDGDIQFLERVYNDMRNYQSLEKRHPEYNALLAGFIDLYCEIIATGLKNEPSQLKE